jgi:hypothetical protein
MNKKVNGFSLAGTSRVVLTKGFTEKGCRFEVDHSRVWEWSWVRRTIAVREYGES